MLLLNRFWALTIDSDSVRDNHDDNYVSWWPAGRQIARKPTEYYNRKNPDLKLRWYDLSQSSESLQQIS